MDKMKRAELENLLFQLVQINSPYFHEQRIMKFVLDWCISNGINARLHKYHEGKITDFHGQNIIIEHIGEEEGPTIHLNGHLDTVQKTSGWDYSPKGEIRGNRFYGLGSLDMKSGCASILMALKTFVHKNKNFKGKIIASLVSVEEGPFGMGTNALIEEGYLKDIDLSIITEPSSAFTGNSFPDICLGARGGYGLSIEVFGKSAHAATPEKGISAALDAAKIVQELENIDYKEDPILGKGSACVIGIECDGGACSVPEYAKINLFWHTVRGEEENTIREYIDQTLEKINLDCSYQITFRQAPSEASRGFDAYAIDKDQAYVEDFIKSVQNVTGENPSLSTFQSIGDFNYLGTRIKAPAIIFGPDGANFHSKNEYVQLDSLYFTTKTLYNFLEKTLTI